MPYLEKIREKIQANEVFPLSAFKLSHTKALKKLILKYLPKQNALYEKDYITDRSERFIVAEFIREKLMRNLSNEIPYELTVEIEKFDLDGRMYRIAARIFVDKSSQKSIVIGHKGQMLKKIGEESRLSIEGFLEKKVYINNKKKLDLKCDKGHEFSLYLNNIKPDRVVTDIMRNLK